jgi:anti-anti-sigma factor
MTGDPPPRPPAGPLPTAPPGPLSESAPPAATDAPILDQVFDADSLYALRAAVAAHAADAGLSPGRADDLVIAVHELAANAVRHGAGHGRLRVWRADHALLCEISDDGTPLAADADQRPSGESGESGETRNPAAPWQTEPGHGLSLVRQVADQASLISGQEGTLATISFALGPAEAQFRLDHQHRGGCAVVAVTGPLDLSSAGQLTETIDVLLAETPDLSLVLDLAGLAGWDSVGLAALITAQQRISASPPARMVLACLPEHLSRHLTQAGLAAGFRLAASAAAAVSMLT